MRRNLARTIESVMLVVLLMPVGMLLANNTYQPPAVTSSTANWHDVEQASNLFNQMETLAVKTRREVARLQTQGYELNWQEHAAKLAGARYDINTIGNDLMQLSEMRSKLEPWQQSLIHKITPEIHEMAYQTQAAIIRLDAGENRTDLASGQYPQNINQIYKNSNEMANTIQTVTQYAKAEQKMAELSKMNGTGARS